MKSLAWIAVIVVGAATASAAPPAATTTTPTLVEVARDQLTRVSARRVLAERRQQVIAWLAEYREAGQFPMGADGLPVSRFLDDRGVRCPMAEIISRSGHDDLVLAVAREHNAVRLADVDAGPLHAWMLASGLTRSEIAMVQGAMELDYHWQLEPANVVPQIATAQIRGRLETAERTLRDHSDAALAEVTAALPRTGLPKVRVVGAVVPPRAMPAVATGPSSASTVLPPQHGR